MEAQWVRKSGGIRKVHFWYNSRWRTAPPNWTHWNRNDCAADCSISQKFGTVFDHVKADALCDTFKVESQTSRSQLDVTYQQLKRYKSGSDKLTDLKLGENYQSEERNVWHMFKVIRSIRPKYKCDFVGLRWRNTWKYRLIAKLLLSCRKLGVASYLMQNALSMQIHFYCNMSTSCTLLLYVVCKFCFYKSQPCYYYCCYYYYYYY